MGSRKQTSPISSPDDISAEWLTAALSGSGVLDRGEAVAVRVTFSKTLQVSQVAHLEIEYSPDGSPAAPRKLFLKLSLQNGSTETHPNIRNSEIDFYRTVASKTPSPELMNCYHASLASETGESVLLLEDLSETHFQSPQKRAPSLEYSRSAIECLARFHAHWWDDPRVGIEVGKIFDAAWLETFLSDLEISVGRFLSFLGDDLSSRRRAIYKKMLAASPTIWGRVTDRSGLTVTHGDTHWWNFLFPKVPAADRTKIFDWQLWHIDLGPRDLAFLVALGGFAERRPEFDDDLLHLYHDTLLSAGVEKYSWNQFWEVYRSSAIRNLNVAVTFWSQGKHRQTWTDALERAFQSFDELGCEELL